jgi:hypothetical protein
VLLTGGSAGGLAAFLHADYVRTLLPKSVEKYKVCCCRHWRGRGGGWGVRLGARKKGG